MTQLLVSVRSVAEAAEALAGRAAYIDVKEPRRGALGFADAQVLREVADVVGQRAVLSAALGEIDAPMPQPSFSELAGFRYAKVGLAGATDLRNWPRVWEEIITQLPLQLAPVAVAYADWRTCAAPPPGEILAHARTLARPCRALLIDTFAKEGATLFDSISPAELSEVLASAQAQRWLTVIAGSLRREHLPVLLALRPDIVAVRGAVCEGGREGILSGARVTEFRADLARQSHGSNCARRKSFAG